MSPQLVPPPGSEPKGEPDDGEPRGVDLWIMPYLRDSALWPVTLVVIAHAVAFFAVVLLAVARDRSPAAIGGLGVLGYLSLLAVRFEVKREGSPRGITGLIVVTWLLSAVTAYYGGRWGYI